MATWHVTVGLAASEAFDEDTPFDVAEELADYAAVLSVSRDFMTASVLLTITAQSVLEASSEAVGLVTAAAKAAGMDASATSVQVQSDAEFDAELATPVFPEVVGYAEIAQMAQVTRQRARQFAQLPNFPAPVIETAQGPLMAKSAVERWLETRNTRSGRPRKPVTV